MGFFRQGYSNGLPFPPPGYLPDQGVEPDSLVSQADSLSTEPAGKPSFRVNVTHANDESTAGAFLGPLFPSLNIPHSGISCAICHLSSPREVLIGIFHRIKLKSLWLGWNLGSVTELLQRLETPQ